MRGIVLSVISLLSLSTVALADDGSVGLRDLKYLVNSVSFASTSLDRTRAAREVIRLEQESVDGRTLHLDRVTAADSLLDKVEVNQNSVVLKLIF